MNIRAFPGCAFSCLSLLLAGPGAAQPFFADVTDQTFEAKPFVARSTAFGDYDNDGWPDLLLAEDRAEISRLALWHNEGNGRFADRTLAIQGELTPQWKGGGSIFGDYDNDGDLDLYVPVGAYASASAGRNILLRNDRGVFRDVALEAGLTDVLPTDNAIWLDYDRDGYLDLYTGNLGAHPDGSGDPTVRNKLYRNQGNGRFADVTGEAGLDIQFGQMIGGSNGGLASGDFNDDGWSDLYVGVLGDRNRLFLNDTKGGFRDATTGEIGDPGNAFGVAVGDIDNDGDLEIFQAAGGSGGLQRSLMLLNLGQGQFLDVTDGVGLSRLALEQGEVDGAALGDLDNDGDIDLLIAYPSFLFINDGNGIFTDQTAQSGISDVGWSLSLGDYDLDGFLDVVLSGNHMQTLEGKLYRNTGNNNHHLRVELVGTKSNRNGIGARLIATSGDLRQTREILGGLGYYQDELVAHFGLGQRTTVDRLEVRWPSGQVDVLTDIPADQKIRVFEGKEGYHLVQPMTWKCDAPDAVAVGGEFKVAATVHPALFEEGARITQVAADLSAFGGSAALPLADRGEGVYGLDPVSVKVAGDKGRREVAVLVEQATSLGPHWSRVSKGVLVAPNEDLVIFGDEVGAGWLVQPIAGSAKLDLQERRTVYQGQGAMRVEANAFTLELLPAVPIDPTGYTALRLAFHPGDAVAGFRGAFNVTVKTVEATGPFYVKLLYGSQEGLHLNMDQKEWQVVEIPLAAFGVLGKIEDIRLLGSLKGRFYLDDLRLVAATPSPATLVEEERTAALPQSLFLSQNFPNPFNSSTVIRFALPASAEVELAVYNLAGQRVATLAEGVREAGSYTLRWDGRDEQGDELASGVYLYRLRAGVKAEMKKLVLVR